MCGKLSMHANNNNFVVTLIFTILQEYLHIKLKELDNSSSANLQVAWANLDGPHLYYQVYRKHHCNKIAVTCR